MEQMKRTDGRSRRALGGTTARRRKKLAAEIRRYLQEHIERKVTIAELAGVCHVSETQVKKCFKAFFGTTVHVWFRHEKMLAAATLLKETDLSVLEIAGRFGYDNGSKFARAFSNSMGVSPSIYRQQYREISDCPDVACD